MKKCQKCKKEVKVLYLDKIRREWHCEKCTEYLKTETKKNSLK